MIGHHREDDWLWIALQAEWRDVSAKPKEIVSQTAIRAGFAAVSVSRGHSRQR